MAHIVVVTILVTIPIYSHCRSFHMYCWISPEVAFLYLKISTISHVKLEPLHKVS
jgi:hypothetical protein